MANLLEGKSAIVTGAGRGIGRGVAKLMAGEGASVVVVDPGVNVDGSGTDSSIAEQVVAEIREDGGTAVASQESVTSMSGGERIVQTAVDNFGKLDIVVTVAGILRDRMIFNMAEEEWDDVIAVHLKGTFTIVKHACILFRQQRSGRVITFSSTTGLYTPYLHAGAIAFQVMGLSAAALAAAAAAPGIVAIVAWPLVIHARYL